MLALLFLAVLFLPAGCSEAGTPEQRFWRWFEANEARMREVYERRATSPDDLQALAREIGGEFDRLGIDLVFEFGQAGDEVYEFVVSADGIREKIPDVGALVKAAPQIAGWRIIPFRQRAEEIPGVEFGDHTLTDDTVWYRLMQDGRQADLMVYVDGLARENRQRMIGAAFILLDQALGEYDVMTKLRHIDFDSLPLDPAGAGLKPLRDLRAEFDAALPLSRP